MNEIIKGMGNITCHRERQEALNLWNLLYKDKLTKLAESVFDSKTAEVYFNPNSGFVFLSDEDYNTVMDNEEILDLFINTPYDGREGFFDELIGEFEDMHEDDKEYMRNIATDEEKEKYPILNEVE